MCLRNVLTLVVLYLISSASPSGGMKLIACSDSNLESFTHLGGQERCESSTIYISLSGSYW